MSSQTTNEIVTVPTQRVVKLRLGEKFKNLWKAKTTTTPKEPIREWQFSEYSTNIFSTNKISTGSTNSFKLETTNALETFQNYSRKIHFEPELLTLFETSPPSTKTTLENTENTNILIEDNLEDEDYPEDVGKPLQTEERLSLSRSETSSVWLATTEAPVEHTWSQTSASSRHSFFGKKTNSRAPTAKTDEYGVLATIHFDKDLLLTNKSPLIATSTPLAKTNSLERFPDIHETWPTESQTRASLNTLNILELSSKVNAPISFGDVATSLSSSTNKNNKVGDNQHFPLHEKVPSGAFEGTTHLTEPTQVIITENLPNTKEETVTEFSKTIGSIIKPTASSIVHDSVQQTYMVQNTGTTVKEEIKKTWNKTTPITPAFQIENTILSKNQTYASSTGSSAYASKSHITSPTISNLHSTKADIKTSLKEKSENIATATLELPKVTSVTMKFSKTTLSENLYKSTMVLERESEKFKKPAAVTSKEETTRLTTNAFKSVGPSSTATELKRISETKYFKTSQPKLEIQDEELHHLSQAIKTESLTIAPPPFKEVINNERSSTSAKFTEIVISNFQEPLSSESSTSFDQAETWPRLTSPSITDLESNSEATSELEIKPSTELKHEMELSNAATHGIEDFETWPHISAIGVTEFVNLTLTSEDTDIISNFDESFLSQMPETLLDELRTPIVKVPSTIESDVEFTKTRNKVNITLASLIAESQQRSTISILHETKIGALGETEVFHLSTKLTDTSNRNTEEDAYRENKISLTMESTTDSGTVKISDMATMSSVGNPETELSESSELSTLTTFTSALPEIFSEITNVKTTQPKLELTSSNLHEKEETFLKLSSTQLTELSNTMTVDALINENKSTSRVEFVTSNDKNPGITTETVSSASQTYSRIKTDPYKLVGSSSTATELNEILETTDFKISQPKLKIQDEELHHLSPPIKIDSSTIAPQRINNENRGSSKEYKPFLATSNEFSISTIRVGSSGFGENQLATSTEQSSRIESIEVTSEMPQTNLKASTEEIVLSNFQEQLSSKSSTSFDQTETRPKLTIPSITDVTSNSEATPEREIQSSTELKHEIELSNATSHSIEDFETWPHISEIGNTEFLNLTSTYEDTDIISNFNESFLSQMPETLLDEIQTPTTMEIQSTVKNVLEFPKTTKKVDISLASLTPESQHITQLTVSSKENFETNPLNETTVSQSAVSSFLSETSHYTLTMEPTSDTGAVTISEMATMSSIGNPNSQLPTLTTFTSALPEIFSEIADVKTTQPKLELTSSNLHEKEETTQLTELSNTMTADALIDENKSTSRVEFVTSIDKKTGPTTEIVSSASQIYSHTETNSYKLVGSSSTATELKKISETTDLISSQPKLEIQDEELYHLSQAIKMGSSTIALQPFNGIISNESSSSSTELTESFSSDKSLQHTISSKYYKHFLTTSNEFSISTFRVGSTEFEENKLATSTEQSSRIESIEVTSEIPQTNLKASTEEIVPSNFQEPLSSKSSTSFDQTETRPKLTIPPITDVTSNSEATPEREMQPSTELKHEMELSNATSRSIEDFETWPHISEIGNTEFLNLTSTYEPPDIISNFNESFLSRMPETLLDETPITKEVPSSIENVSEFTKTTNKMDISSALLTPESQHITQPTVSSKENFETNPLNGTTLPQSAVSSVVSKTSHYIATSLETESEVFDQLFSTTTNNISLNEFTTASSISSTQLLFTSNGNTEEGAYRENKTALTMESITDTGAVTISEMTLISIGNLKSQLSTLTTINSTLPEIFSEITDIKTTEPNLELTSSNLHEKEETFLKLSTTKLTEFSNSETATAEGLLNANKATSRVEFVTGSVSQTDSHTKTDFYKLVGPYSTATELKKTSEITDLLTSQPKLKIQDEQLYHLSQGTKMDSSTITEKTTEDLFQKIKTTRTVESLTDYTTKTPQMKQTTSSVSDHQTKSYQSSETPTSLRQFMGTSTKNLEIDSAMDSAGHQNTEPLKLFETQSTPFKFGSNSLKITSEAVGLKTAQPKLEVLDEEFNNLSHPNKAEYPTTTSGNLSQILSEKSTELATKSTENLLYTSESLTDAGKANAPIRQTTSSVGFHQTEFRQSSETNSSTQFIEIPTQSDLEAFHSQRTHPIIELTSSTLLQEQQHPRTEFKEFPIGSTVDKTTHIGKSVSNNAPIIPTTSFDDYQKIQSIKSLETSTLLSTFVTKVSEATNLNNSQLQLGLSSSSKPHEKYSSTETIEFSHGNSLEDLLHENQTTLGNDNLGGVTIHNGHQNAESYDSSKTSPSLKTITPKLEFLDEEFLHLYHENQTTPKIESITGVVAITSSMTQSLNSEGHPETDSNQSSEVFLTFTPALFTNSPSSSSLEKQESGTNPISTELLFLNGATEVDLSHENRTTSVREDVNKITASTIQFTYSVDKKAESNKPSEVSETSIEFPSTLFVVDETTHTKQSVNEFGTITTSTSEDRSSTSMPETESYRPSETFSTSIGSLTPKVLEGGVQETTQKVESVTDVGTVASSMTQSLTTASFPKTEHNQSAEIFSAFTTASFTDLLSSNLFEKQESFTKRTSTTELPGFLNGVTGENLFRGNKSTSMIEDVGKMTASTIGHQITEPHQTSLGLVNEVRTITTLTNKSLNLTDHAEIETSRLFHTSPTLIESLITKSPETKFEALDDELYRSQSVGAPTTLTSTIGANSFTHRENTAHVAHSSDFLNTKFLAAQTLPEIIEPTVLHTEKTTKYTGIYTETNDVGYTKPNFNNYLGIRFMTKKQELEHTEVANVKPNTDEFLHRFSVKLNSIEPHQVRNISTEMSITEFLDHTKLLSGELTESVSFNKIPEPISSMTSVSLASLPHFTSSSPNSETLNDEDAETKFTIDRNKLKHFFEVYHLTSPTVDEHFSKIGKITFSSEPDKVTQKLNHEISDEKMPHGSMLPITSNAILPTKFLTDKTVAEKVEPSAIFTEKTKVFPPTTEIVGSNYTFGMAAGGSTDLKYSILEEPIVHYTKADYEALGSSENISKEKSLNVSSLATVIDQADHVYTQAYSTGNLEATVTKVDKSTNEQSSILVPHEEVEDHEKEEKRPSEHSIMQKETMVTDNLKYKNYSLGHESTEANEQAKTSIRNNLVTTPSGISAPLQDQHNLRVLTSSAANEIEKGEPAPGTTNRWPSISKAVSNKFVTDDHLHQDITRVTDAGQGTETNENLLLTSSSIQHTVDNKNLAVTHLIINDFDLHSTSKQITFPQSINQLKTDKNQVTSGVTSSDSTTVGDVNLTLAKSSVLDLIESTNVATTGTSESPKNLKINFSDMDSAAKQTTVDDHSLNQLKTSHNLNQATPEVPLKGEVTVGNENLVSITSSVHQLIDNTLVDVTGANAPSEDLNVASFTHLIINVSDWNSASKETTVDDHSLNRLQSSHSLNHVTSEVPVKGEVTVGNGILASTRSSMHQLMENTHLAVTRANASSEDLNVTSPTYLQINTSDWNSASKQATADDHLLNQMKTSHSLTQVTSEVPVKGEVTVVNENLESITSYVHQLIENTLVDVTGANAPSEDSNMAYSTTHLKTNFSDLNSASKETTVDDHSLNRLQTSHSLKQVTSEVPVKGEVTVGNENLVSITSSVPQLTENTLVEVTGANAPSEDLNKAYSTTHLKTNFSDLNSASKETTVDDHSLNRLQTSHSLNQVTSEVPVKGEVTVGNENLVSITSSVHQLIENRLVDVTVANVPSEDSNMAYSTTHLKTNFSDLNSASKETTVDDHSLNRLQTSHSLNQVTSEVPVKGEVTVGNENLVSITSSVHQLIENRLVDVTVANVPSEDLNMAYSTTHLKTNFSDLNSASKETTVDDHSLNRLQTSHSLSQVTSEVLVKGEVTVGNGILASTGGSTNQLMENTHLSVTGSNAPSEDLNMVSSTHLQINTSDWNSASKQASVDDHSLHQWKTGHSLNQVTLEVSAEGEITVGNKNLASTGSSVHQLMENTLVAVTESSESTTGDDYLQNQLESSHSLNQVTPKVGEATVENVNLALSKSSVHHLMENIIVAVTDTDKSEKSHVTFATLPTAAKSTTVDDNLLNLLSSTESHPKVTSIEIPSITSTLLVGHNEEVSHFLDHFSTISQVNTNLLTEAYNSGKFYEHSTETSFKNHFTTMQENAPMIQTSLESNGDGASSQFLTGSNLFISKIAEKDYLVSAVSEEIGRNDDPVLGFDNLITPTSGHTEEDLNTKFSNFFSESLSDRTVKDVQLGHGNVTEIPLPHQTHTSSDLTATSVLYNGEQEGTSNHLTHSTSSSAMTSISDQSSPFLETNRKITETETFSRISKGETSENEVLHFSENKSSGLSTKTHVSTESLSTPYQSHSMTTNCTSKASAEFSQPLEMDKVTTGSSIATISVNLTSVDQFNRLSSTDQSVNKITFMEPSHMTTGFHIDESEELLHFTHYNVNQTTLVTTNAALEEIQSVEVGNTQNTKYLQLSSKITTFENGIKETVGGPQFLDQTTVARENVVSEKEQSLLTFSSQTSDEITDKYDMATGKSSSTISTSKVTGKNDCKVAEHIGPVFINLPVYPQNASNPIVINFEKYYSSSPVSTVIVDDEETDTIIDKSEFLTMKIEDFNIITEFPITLESTTYAEAMVNTTDDINKLKQTSASLQTGKSTRVEGGNVINEEQKVQLSSSVTTVTTEIVTKTTTETGPAVVKTTPSVVTVSNLTSVFFGNKTTSTLNLDSHISVDLVTANHIVLTENPITMFTTLSEKVTTSRTTEFFQGSNVSEVAKFNEESTCNLTDFSASNHCVCSVDNLVKDLRNKLVHNDVNFNVDNYTCPTFQHVDNAIILSNDSIPQTTKSKRSIDEAYSIVVRRETVENQNIDKALNEQFELKNTDNEMFATPGMKIIIPCMYSKELKEVYENSPNYTWTFLDNIPLTEGKIQETEGTLSIENITPQDGGNYTCTATTSISDKVMEKKYEHHVTVVNIPSYALRTTILYNSTELCNPGDVDILSLYLPKAVERLICGSNYKICSVEVKNSKCVNADKYTAVNVSVIVEPLSVLMPSVNTSSCDVSCEMKIYSRIILFLIKNLEAVQKLPLIFRFSFRQLKLIPIEVVSRKTKQQRFATQAPKLIITCPPGFGYFKKTHICGACGRNTFSRGDETFCSPCPAGKYQPMVGSKSCLACSTPLQDPYCLRVMYSNTHKFRVLLGIAVSVVIAMVILLICLKRMKKGTSSERNSKLDRDSYAKNRRHSRRRYNRDDVEIQDLQPLISGSKEKRRTSVRIPPEPPPPDFS